MIGEVMKSASFRGGGLHGKGIFSTQGPTQTESWCCCWGHSPSLVRSACRQPRFRCNLHLMRPLLDHDGLTAWYIRMAASLAALAAPFSSRRARRIVVRASVGRGLFFCVQACGR